MQLEATAPPLQQGRLKPLTHRIESIDLLRGIVMILMALDHTRDFFHDAANTGDPLDLQTTTPLLFITRWITHFCAPVFVFLSGTSAFLQSQRKSKKQLSSFLIKRGLWLIIAEILIITFGITFDVQYSFVILQVIWAIGISMVVLGLVIWLPFQAILAIGFLIVFGHNALDFLEKDPGRKFSVLYSFLHRPTVLPVTSGHGLGIFYPFLPWTGLMMLGYCFGKLYEQKFFIGKRNKIIAGIGVGLLMLFVLLRATEIYGDPKPWATQRNALFTFFDFIDVQKYPPSLLYVCVTLGPALILLSLLDRVRNKVTDIITVYGRVPFLYYVLHFYILHILVVALFLARGHSWAEGVKGDANLPLKFLLPGEGYSLGIVYLIWISVVIALYPVCKWFSTYKRTHKQWWLSYL